MCVCAGIFFSQGERKIDGEQTRRVGGRSASSCQSKTRLFVATSARKEKDPLVIPKQRKRKRFVVRVIFYFSFKFYDNIMFYLTEANENKTIAQIIREEHRE